MAGNFRGLPPRCASPLVAKRFARFMVTSFTLSRSAPPISVLVAGYRASLPTARCEVLEIAGVIETVGAKLLFG